MENFNLHRFGTLAKWSYFAYKSSYIKMTSIMFFVLFAIFELNSIGTHPSNHPDGLVFTSIITYIVFIIVGASLNFEIMKEKENRLTFLMLPASNLEKFVSRWLYITVGFTVSYFIALLGADLLRMLFLLISGHEVVGSVFIDFFKTLSDSSVFANHIYVNGNDFYTNNSWAIPFTICMNLLCVWMHSIYILGGTFFRRNAWLFTTISLILAVIILSWIGTECGGFDLNLQSTDSSMKLNIASVIFLILIVFNYIASYKLFTRMQVINNKWINA
jgi:hypothetical protein